MIAYLHELGHDHQWEEASRTPKKGRGPRKGVTLSFEKDL